MDLVCLIWRNGRGLTRFERKGEQELTSSNTSSLEMTPSPHEGLWHGLGYDFLAEL